MVRARKSGATMDSPSESLGRKCKVLSDSALGTANAGIANADIDVLLDKRYGISQR